MNKFYELENLTFQIEREAVFKSLNCFEDSPVYDDFAETYEEIYEEMLGLVEPVGIIGLGTMPESIATKEYPAGTPIMYMVTSVGNGIKQESTKGFNEGDYVKGMLCDAMADDALFSMEGQLMEKLKEICAEHKVGIKARLEAPHHISMGVQKEAWEYLELEKRFGIKISSGYMFDPVKTSCQLLILTEDASVFQAEHDCRKCPNLNCKLRHIPDTEVTVYRDGTAKKIVVKENETLLEALIRENYYVSAVCGGKGRCGKCRVQVKKGKAFITDEDRAVFTPQELMAGWRLSCRVYPQEELGVVLDQKDESEFEILTEFAGTADGQTDTKAEKGSDSQTGTKAKKSGDSQTGTKTEKGSDSQTGTKAEEGSDSQTGTKAEKNANSQLYDIAVDIGTTTIALALVSRETKEVLRTVSTINGQRVYGADVISRIQASIDGKKEQLKESIRKDLRKGIQRLITEAGIAEAQIGQIAIGGNTTMGHLLMGYDCDTLGVYPFAPVNIDFIKGASREILGEAAPGSSQEILDGSVEEAETVLLPGISTYVGGDIVSGLYACGFEEKEEVCLLVDLGTNGEMALGNKDRIFVTSTAAGPAFEGGNITWGTGSIPGAICSVKINGTEVKVQTIGDQQPQGICGTGVVETTAELVREEIAEDSGLLDEEYFDDGFPLARTADGKDIVFTQKDVREIQLAKAAVRAGIETLLLRYGVSKEEVAKVYIAGGFGYKLDIDKAVAIGMIPEEFKNKTVAIGNSSLAGAVKYLKEDNGEEILRHLVEISKEIGLSSDKDFNEFYMDSMFFEIG